MCDTDKRILDETFVTADHLKAQQDYEILDPGKYGVSIVMAKEKAAKNGNGSYIECKFSTIAEDRFIYSRCTLKNSNPVAVDWGKRQFAQMLNVLGVESIKDLSSLDGRKLIVEIIHEKDNNDNDRVKVTGYEAHPDSEQEEDVPF